MKKKISILGYITYGILMMLALIFYMERTIFIDLSFHLFYIIKDGDFAIQNFRFGSFLTQAIPLIGSKIGLSLEAIAKSYSIGFVLYYFTIFILSIRWTKSYQFGIVVLLFNTLMVNHTFYWIQSELPQGLAMLILFFSYIFYAIKHDKLKNVSHLVISSFFLFFLVFIHPLIIFPMTFGIAFFYLNNNNTDTDRKHWLSYGLSFLVLFGLKSMFFKTTYDSSSMGGLSNIKTLFPNYFKIQSNIDFANHIFSDYYFLIISLIVIVIFYIKNKQYYKLILVTSFFLGYLFMVNISYPDGTEQFYIENLYLPLSLFIIIPIVFDIFNLLNNNHVLVILALILTIKTIHIAINHRIYSDRIEYLSKYLDKTSKSGSKKMIVKTNKDIEDQLMMTWASPYEFWLLSTIKDKETRSIVITDHPKDLQWTLKYNKKFITKWGNFDYNSLPSKYFILQDTSYYKSEN